MPSNPDLMQNNSCRGEPVKTNSQHSLHAVDIVPPFRWRSCLLMREVDSWRTGQGSGWVGVGVSFTLQSPYTKTHNHTLTHP
jgi:hypothetical protein